MQAKKLEKIEIRNLSPMLAMISAGKTSILKAILNIDFLEATAGIGTKFVNIIRYNPEVGKNPKFYHLIVKKENNEYNFYKDPSYNPITGGEKILKENMRLNEKYKKDKKIPYEELFFMIEIGHTNMITDQLYLKNYDLVDIPGVSEYRENDSDKGEAPSAGAIQNSEGKKFDSIEKVMLNYNPDKEKNYLTEIFKIIKKYINNGMIVFSVDNFQLTENYEIIGKFQKVINKPIENYLILLNKVDKSENIEKDLKILEGKIVAFFPGGSFNFTKNTVVPCSALQLENESKLENDFRYLLYYHFLNFLIVTKKQQSETPTGTTYGFSFIDFLKKINPIQKINKKKFDDLINPIIDDKNNLPNVSTELKSIIEGMIRLNKTDNTNMGFKPEDFEVAEIEKIKENIEDDDDNEEKEEGETDNFNINEQDEKSIILYYYALFKNKNKEVFPEKSEEYLKVVNYFTFKNEKKNEDKKKIEEVEKENLKHQEKQKTRINKIEDLEKRTQFFYNSVSSETTRKIDMKKLKHYINSSIIFLKMCQYFYIPFLGVSNAGKSTILNDLIGYLLLPAQKNECTKKGLLIKHWKHDYPVLRITHFKKAETSNNSQTYYYFEPELKKQPLAIGVEEIRRTLEASNYQFPKDHEDFFLELDVNIKFINDLDIDNDLKEKICFIDLPGHGTNNEFEEKGVYQELINSCNLFLFVVFNLKIKENDNQKMLDSLFKNMTNFRGITSKAFLKKCLFIVNSDSQQEISPRTEAQAKNDVLSVISHKEKNDLKDLNDINICFFNAKYYENYLSQIRYYQSGGYIVLKEYNEYRKKKDKFFKGLFDFNGGTFNKYLLGRLKDNIKKDIKQPFDENQVTPNPDIEQSVKDILEKYALKFKKKEIQLVVKYITFGCENIFYSNYYSESKYDEFGKKLYNCIKEAKGKEDKEINENLYNCFKILDDVFEVDPTTKFGKCKDAPIKKVVKPHMEKDLKDMKVTIEKYLASINKEFTDNDVTKILNEGSNKISTALTAQKSGIKNNLNSKSWSSIQTDFHDIFKKETRELKTNLLKVLKTSSDNIKKNYDECYNQLDKFYLKPCERKSITYETYIANKLGGNNKIEQTLEDLITDIIKESKTAADWEKNDFFGWLGAKVFSDNYLNKVIDEINKLFTPKINLFCDSIKKNCEDFKKTIIDDINSSKTRVENEMEKRKKKELIEINLVNAKNEEDKKKWEEEKRIYEENVKSWEEKCKKYRILRDDITNVRLANE